MPPGPEMPPLTDSGNGLLDTSALSNMVVGMVPTEEGGAVGVLTIRTATTTLTIPVRSREEAQNWVTGLTALRDALPAASRLETATDPGLIAAVAGQRT